MTLKQALWEIVRDDNIIITNQNIDWLLDRALKKASGDAQTLKESILERKEILDEKFPTNENKSNNLDVKSNNLDVNMYRQGTLSNPQWISVDERLPDKYKSVLISCEDEVRIDCIDEYGWWHYNYLYRVTHWMPLPEPPKKEGVDNG
jgi:hypothetical protein